MKSMFVIFFFVLIFAPTIHYVAKHGDKSGVRFFKFLNLALIIAMVVLFIVAFSLMGSFGQDKIIDKWAQLSSMDKLKYNDDINNLVDINKKNLLLHAIYNIVLTVLFVVVTIALYNYDFVLPNRWVRSGKSRVSFVEDSLIVVPRKKQVELGANKRRSEPKNRTLDLPAINEEKTSLMGDNRLPEVSLFPTSNYQNEQVINRTFGESPERQKREFEDPALRSSTFGADPERYPNRSPEMTRGYDDEGLRSRNMEGGVSNNRMADIEMTKTTYMNNPNNPPKKRQFG